jgi:hypothetical protein
MRSFLLITGLLVAVALAFVMGVFVGARYEAGAGTSPDMAAANTGSPSSTGRDDPNSSSTRTNTARSTTDRQTDSTPDSDNASAKSTNGAGEHTSDKPTNRGQNTETAARGGGGAADAASASDNNSGNATTDGDAAGPGAKRADTWLQDAGPAPSDTDTVNTGSGDASLVDGKHGAPTVLTTRATEPETPVYAVQTVHALRQKQAHDLARRLSGDRPTAHVVPAFGRKAGSHRSGGPERSYVRLGVFAQRDTAAAAAERAMRPLDRRLHVVRVRRPNGTETPRDGATNGSGPDGDVSDAS